MPSEMTEEQEMIVSSVRQLLDSAGAVGHLRQLRSQNMPRGYVVELWRSFCEAGFGGIMIPQSYAGAELGIAEAAAIMQELGRTLVPMPFLATSILATAAMNRAATDEQKQRLYPGMAQGDLIVAFALEEHAKHRPDSISLSAVPASDGFVLSGEKRFVLNGAGADYYIVVARSGGDGITMFLVDSRSPGLSVTSTKTIDSHVQAKILFDDCPVPQESVLGEVGAAQSVLDDVLVIGRIAVASELLGIADECLARTVAYLKERRQFGVVIGEFQALQHRAARLFVEIEITRSIILSAVSRKCSVAEMNLLSSVAKIRAGTTAALSVQEAVQMHGGVGMTDEIDIGLFVKRAQILQEAFGDVNYHLNRIAEIGGY